MSQGTILFVHGTGVRLKSYREGFDDAAARAQQAGIAAPLVACAWGDPLGVEFEGLSLPDPPSEAQLKRDGEDFAQWSWLFADPLFELDKLTIRAAPDAQQPRPRPGAKSPWQALWGAISAYQPSDDLTQLLRRGGLEPLWAPAWSAVIVLSDIPPLAFERSAHELPEASQALARALVAQLHVEALARSLPGPSRTLRELLVKQLLTDWKQKVLARSGFFASMFKRLATSALRRHRNDFSDAAALPLGDILLYQSRGQEIRDFIRGKIGKAQGPVTLLAHSLGGIACFDLLAMPDPPPVARLITVGSQSPFFYELGALTSLKPPQRLPQGFPPWLNVFDRNDFLSYFAGRLFEEAKDMEVDSGQPFPDSHSAYFSNDEVWGAVRDFGKQRQ